MFINLGIHQSKCRPTEATPTLRGTDPVKGQRWFNVSAKSERLNLNLRDGIWRKNCTRNEKGDNMIDYSS